MHTYTSIYIHVVFATWNRYPFLDHATRPRLHAYFAGTARKLGVVSVTVGGVEDHLHFMGRFDPAVAFSAVIGQLKKSSTDWLHENFTPLSKFRWQRGFGGFSVSVDRVPSVNRYIERQEEHHRGRSFREEIDELLREFGMSIGDVGLL